MRSTVSILLLVIIFILTPVLFVVTSARYTVLTANFLKQELVRLDVYALAASQLDEQIAKIQIDSQYPITHAEISDIAHQVLSETWLQRNVENVLTRVDTWLKEKPGAVLVLPLDLRQPKQELTIAIDTLLTEKLSQLQPCPDPKRPKEEQGICQFAGMTMPQLKEQLGQVGLNPDLVNEFLPDTLDLLNPDLSKIVGPDDAANPDPAAAKSKEIRKNLEIAKARYQQVDFLLKLALVIYGLLLALYLVINAARGRRRLVRWGGVLLVVVGLWPLALGIASSPVIEQQVIPNIRFDTTAPKELVDLGPQVIRDVRRSLFDPLVFIGGIVLAIGLGGIIGAHWIDRPLSPSKPSR